MTDLDALHIRELRLWAHVGVLEHERREGQWFRLDITLYLDLSRSATADDLGSSVDYSHTIAALQELAAGLRCLTIEHFSEQVLDPLDSLHGPLPVWLRLCKCDPPVSGFDGWVAVERVRHGASRPTA